MFLEVLNTNYGHLGIYSKEYFSTDYTKSLTRMFLVNFISISNLDVWEIMQYLRPEKNEK